ncbi:sialate O-acetylesterase [Lysobacter cavernae]|uniref:Sialate O-acetylesterase n=1 Tax=Lysobacter cavernae TaxID=1685901 RepID=A0ABV7RLJ6_9GAMM
MTGKGIAFGVALMFSSPSFAALDLPLMFSDGAIVQRDKPLPVWGWATPGAKVKVGFDGKTAKATAGQDGRWQVQLPAHRAGGPYTLTVTGDGETRSVSDVLVGDVWLASGQSNMEWPLLQTDGAQAEIARANDTSIRHFKVPKSWADKPETHLAGGSWKAASPQTAGDFSAVAYYFAKDLRAATGVPVGIIDSSWGGSAIEAWMGLPMLGLDKPALDAKLRAKIDADAKVEAGTRAKIARWPNDANADFSAAKLDERDWAAVKVPSIWELQGYPGMDGVAWYRTTFKLSASEAKAGISLGLGQIDDDDETWVNGQRVGGLRQAWNIPREYAVPAAALHAGRNTIAVRVVDESGGGGIGGSATQLYVQINGGARRALTDEWKFRSSDADITLRDEKNQLDTLLYNKMIHPLQPYPLRGVIWYQGESNASDTGATRYRDQFKAMIEGWRGDWHAPKLPFLWVQLANWVSGSDQRDASGVVSASPWATLRESQSAALSLPATAQAVIVDVGDPDDIHPRDKGTVGHRLALGARHVAYGKTQVYSGPVYRGIDIDGDRAILRFDTQGSVVAVRGGGRQARGFELAGADRRWYRATAEVVGDTVVVRSDAVAQPAAARYAWSDNPAEADLVNAEGLPASPFRTQAW